MKFCPKCGSLMIVTSEGYVCPRCGYKETTKVEGKLTEKIENKEERAFGIVEQKVEMLPKVRGVICPKCGNDEAYYWTVQTRAGDEAETRFYKCTKCGFVWREYD